MKKLAVTFLITFIFCTAALYLVYCIPVALLTENTHQSALTMSEEGLYPTRLGVRLDNFTDAIMFETACYDSGLPTWQAAMSSSFAKELEQTHIESLLSYTEGATIHRIRSYSRYWHGYLIFLKPLLLYFNYSQIRTLMYIITFFSLSLILYLIKRNHLSFLYSICFIVSVLIFGGAAFPLSLQFSNMFLLMYAALIILLVFHKKLVASQSFAAFFLAIGMLAPFFDLLTVPLITLAVPLLFCLALDETAGIKFILKNSIAWGFGYCCFWTLKWVIASVSLHKNIIADAFSSAAERSSMQLYDIEFSYFQVVKDNLKHLNQHYILLTVATLIAILCFLILKRCKTSKQPLTFYQLLISTPYIICCAMPLVWYLVFSNHSYEHHWFTYRDLFVSVLGFLFYLCRLYTGLNSQSGNL